jgi:hypothetical protein
MPYLASRQPTKPPPKARTSHREMLMAILPVVVSLAIIAACLLFVLTPFFVIPHLNEHSLIVLL